MNDFFTHVSARRADLAARLASAFPPGTPPIDLDIGCGHGHFLTRYAADNPDRVCLGIDILGDRIERARRKQQRASLSRLHFLKCEAFEFLACAPASLRLHTIFALFPDPWPKRRHRKKRLLQESFLSAAAGRAGEGALLFFRTDDADYLDTASAAVAVHPAWRLETEVPWPCPEPTVFQQKASAFGSFVARRL